MSLSEPSREMASLVVRDGGVWRSMAATLRGYWAQAAGFQRLLYLSGLLLLVSGVVHVGVFLADDLQWAGPVSWRKPVLFGFSFGVTLITMGWIMGFMSMGRWAWPLSVSLTFASLLEVALITMQVWRKVPSHFNLETGFDSSVFDVMGLLVVVIALAVVVLTVRSYGSLSAPVSMVWAIRIGLTMLVASQAVGGLIIANGIAAVVPEPGAFEPEAVATASIFGEAGAMKVPHAVTLHAAQVLPAFAWLLAFTAVAERRRLQIVAVAAAGYVSLAVVAALQTFSGRATSDLTALAAVLALAGVALLIGGASSIVMAFIRSKPRPSATRTPQ